MMHIIATNACIVIRTLVKESSKEMMGHDDKAKTSNGSSLDHLAHPKCQRIEIIGEAIESSSVYLYPFIIEYSIIGISVVYRYVSKSVVVSIFKNQNNISIFLVFC